VKAVVVRQFWVEGRAKKVALLHGHHPAVVESQRATLIAAIRRIQREGLTVVVSPHPNGWHLETDPADRDRLRAFWRTLAPALRTLDPARTVPEVLNEPVFPHDPAGWAALQHQVLASIRQALPNDTVVLTGQDWGSIGGLLALTPEADPNTLYSFHFYDPAELTSLAAYRAGLDTAALAQLPFPSADPLACARDAASPDAATAALVGFVCTQRWNVEAIDGRIARAASWATRNRAAVLAGEFGASVRLNAPARLAWIEAVRSACERAGIGWALWGYDDVMGFNVARPPGRRPSLDGELLRALSMPQPPREAAPPIFVRRRDALPKL